MRAIKPVAAATFSARHTWASPGERGCNTRLRLHLAMMSNAIGLIFLVCTQPVCMYTTVHQFAFAEDFRCVRAVIQKTLRADRRPRRDTLTVPCKGLTAPQGQEDRRESQS